MFCSSRAAQKLNLSSKRKKHQPSLLHPQEPSIYPTNFSGILQVSPPPAPPCLLRAVSKVKENPGMGKVRTDAHQHIHKRLKGVYWLIMLVKYRYNKYAPSMHTRTQPHTHIQIHTNPYLKGRMQSGDTLVHRQHAVWSSPCRCSQISLLECHEFTQFVRPVFFSLNTERQ